MKGLANQATPVPAQPAARLRASVHLNRLSALLRIGLLLWRTLLHVLRGVAICVVVFPFVGAAARRRHITQWTRQMLAVLGVRLVVNGTAASGRVLLCANHVSWLDILVIQAVVSARFVSKSEVQRWPLVGRLATAASTLFVVRSRRRDAVRVLHDVTVALSEGTIVAVFPEGTTGSGRVLLPFHANLMQAAIVAQASIQAVALRFSDRQDRFSSAATFVGATTLVGSLGRIATADGLTAHLTLLPAIDVNGAGRRALAAVTREQIQRVLDDTCAGAEVPR
ncbi:MAG: 1-acyl-sn-glycerol-3-phosphate acyltransferase [Caldimonas sp.]